MSSGNSTSCRMMNSRNSFMTMSPIFVREAVSFAIEWEADSFPYRFHVHVDDLSFRLESAPQMALRVGVSLGLSAMGLLSVRLLAEKMVVPMDMLQLAS